MIQLEHGTLMRYISDRLFAFETQGPDTVIETSSSPYALEQAACGGGIFIVDGHLPERFLSAVRCIPFEGLTQGVDVIVKRSPDCTESPILDLFLEQVTARLQEHLDHLPAAA